MGKQILTDVCLHPDAEGVAEICHNKIQHRAQHIATQHDHHHGKEGFIHLPRQHIIQRATGYERETQIDTCNAHGAQNIQQKQLPMVFKIG